MSVGLLFERHPENPIYIRLHGIYNDEETAGRLRKRLKGHDKPLETARFTVQEGEHEAKA